MKKLFAALLGALLAAGVAQAATGSGSPTHHKHKRATGKRAGDTVMSLTRPKRCASFGVAKKSVGCMAPAVASDTPDTSVMGSAGEHLATPRPHTARH